jgi:hypothetical protein
MSADSTAAAPIPLAVLVAHRDVAARISAALAPHYTYAYTATTFQEAQDVLSQIKALDASQRPKAWVVGGGINRDELAQLKKDIDVPVLVVPQGTIEKVGPPNMAVYAMGMLDGHFRQPQW